MHGLARVEVVEEQPERLVIDVRYLYRDRQKNARGDRLGRECSDYGSVASRSSKRRRASRRSR
jgi:hypothetical protein